MNQSDVQVEVSAELEGIASSYGITEVPDLWKQCWPESQALFPGRGAEVFQDRFIAQSNEVLDLPRGAVKALQHMLSLIRTNEPLARLLWCWYYMIFESKGVRWSDVLGWPMPEIEGNSSSLFVLLSVLPGLPKLLESSKSRGIPSQITVHTFSNVCDDMNSYFEKHGKWGLSWPSWLVNHFRGDLYRLGRMQYMAAGFTLPVRVYQNRCSGKVVALSEAGVEFRSDGLADGTNDIFDNGGWVAQLELDGTGVTGTPIAPSGYALRRAVRLEFCDWTEVLKEGTPILQIHIPEDGEFSRGVCADSLNQALEFYSRYFPEYRFVAFICGSWLLGPELRKVLRPGSNILEFQRLFYTIPIQSGDWDTFYYVWGERPQDPYTLPADTSLRKGILDHMRAGGHFMDGAGFFLRDPEFWGPNADDMAGG